MTDNAAGGGQGKNTPGPRLRHTCASLLIAQGASVKAIQAHLGHATASITLDKYGHLFPDELDVLAGRLDRLRTEALAKLRRTQDGPKAALLSVDPGERPS